MGGTTMGYRNLPTNTTHFLNTIFANLSVVLFLNSGLAQYADEEWGAVFQVATSGGAHRKIQTVEDNRQGQLCQSEVGQARANRKGGRHQDHR